MARASVQNGVSILACTPHITPGVWNNSGPNIRRSVDAFRAALESNGVALHITSGADVHIAPNLVQAIRSGQVLTLHDTRYVLLELPHHIAPPRADTCFMELLNAGYVPLFTHPERLSWMQTRYDLIGRLFDAGVWMQITAGSLTGRFGKRAKDLGERMLRDGVVHIVASDTHNMSSRPPDLASGWEAAKAIVGDEEAYRLVVERPYGILRNDDPSTMCRPRPISVEAQQATSPQPKSANGSKRDAGKRDLLGWMKGLLNQGDDPSR